MWRLIVALILVLCSVSFSSSPAAAQSFSDYFEYSYNVELSTTEVGEGESFTATVTGEVTCNNDLPLAPSEALITSRIIAEHQDSGAEVTLNSSYTVTISPVPSQNGETRQVSKAVSLQFPAGSQSGTYTVVGELIEAKIKAIIWWDVTSYFPSSQAIGSVTYLLGSAGSGGVGGGGGGGGGGSAGVTNVMESVTETGRFTVDVTARGEDGKVELTIHKNTIGKNRMGALLSHITIVEKEAPPAPPTDSNVIGLVYNIGPDGATFDPPITMTFTYDPALMPEGVAEKNLVIAIWDKEADEWVVIADCTVSPEANTITAKVSHFTAFTILAYTRPAAFIASDLSITPAEVGIGEEVTITALITNTGDLSGTHEVTLKIDNVVVASKQLTLIGGASLEETFTTVKEIAGNYTVSVNGLTGTFAVKAAPEPITPEPVTPKPVKWWLVGCIFAAFIILAAAVWLTARRSKA